MQRMWRRGPDGEILRSAPEEPAAPNPELPSAEAAPEPATAAARPRANVRVALKLGFRDTYDYLGTVLLLSLGSALLPLAGALGGHALGTVLFAALPERLGGLLSALLALAGWAAVWGPTAAGHFRFSRNAAARAEPEIFDLAWGFRTAPRRAIGLGLIQALGVALLAGNAYFYLIQRHPLFAVLGATFLYALAFWLLALIYQWPLLVEQELSPAAAIRKSALLVLDNFGYTLGVGLVLGFLALLLWSLVVPGVLLWGGASAFIQTQATRELLRRYGVLPPDPTLDPIADETHELGGRGWHE